jgi:transcriptional antiterminator NusG
MEMSTVEEKYKWYVVRAITGQEKKVKHNIEVELERALKQDHVPEILIPTEKIYQIKNGKKVAKERHAFPGYILVQGDFSDPEVIPLIKSVSGVVGFLGAKDQPVPLRPNELNRISGRGSSQKPIFVTMPKFAWPNKPAT